MPSFYTGTVRYRTLGVIFAVIAVSAGLIYLSTKGEVPAFEYVVLVRGGIEQAVSVTGRVKASQKADLAFEKTGKIRSIYAAVGDRVPRGRVLAVLENGDIAAKLAQAEAIVAAEEAELQVLLSGTREEEVAVQEVEVRNAEAALVDARQNLIDTIRDAFTKSDDAARNKVDQFITNPGSNDPQIDFIVSDSQLETDIESTRVSLGAALGAWSASLAGIGGAEALNAFIAEARANLIFTRSFLDKVARAVNELKKSVDFSQTTIDGYRSDVAAGRTNVNTALSNLTAAEEKLKNAERKLALEEEELSLKKAPPRPEDVAAQEARIEEAKANARNYEAELAKTILRAPIRGVVTEESGEAGEIVAANTIVISLIGESQLEIEAHIPEADIAKVEIGDEARVTLDAYGSSVVFRAAVEKIDPAETILEGVATYKTTLQFAEPDGRIKPGMTANIDIKTGTRKDVLAIPARAVMSKNDGQFVRVLLSDGSVREKEVETGLRGSLGEVEVISGLAEGERVITFFDGELPRRSVLGHSF